MSEDRIYKPALGDGRCELCGRETPRFHLRPVTLEPERPAGKLPNGKLRPYMAARVAYVCRRHEVTDEPVRTPRTTPATGTDKRHPQTEVLFDS